MTREGSGSAERRWVGLSRSFCVCHCQSSPGIPAEIAECMNCDERSFRPALLGFHYKNKPP